MHPFLNSTRVAAFYKLKEAAAVGVQNWVSGPQPIIKETITQFIEAWQESLWIVIMLQCQQCKHSYDNLFVFLFNLLSLWVREKLGNNQPSSTKIFMFKRSRTRESWRTNIPSKTMISAGWTYKWSKEKEYKTVQIISTECIQNWLGFEKHRIMQWNLCSEVLQSSYFRHFASSSSWVKIIQ